MPRSAAAGLGISVATRPAVLDHRQREVEDRRCTDRVEHGVHAVGRLLAHPGLDVLAEVERLDAHLPEHVVVGRQRGAEHPGAAVPGQLGGVQPDAAGGTVEQHGLAVGHAGRRARGARRRCR